MVKFYQARKKIELKCIRCKKNYLGHVRTRKYCFDCRMEIKRERARNKKYGIKKHKTKREKVS